MDKKYIINIQGKDFVLHEGLLNEFFKNGGKEINTRLVSSEGGTYIFKALAIGEKGNFSGHGDANKENVNSMIVKHLIRMAETRAVNRALRFYNNIGMCSADELGGSTASPAPVKQALSTNEVIVPESNLKVCERDGNKFRLVPGGIGKKSGKPYSSFYSCEKQGCDRTMNMAEAATHVKPVTAKDVQEAFPPPLPQF